jgi:hypothetical protein
VKHILAAIFILFMPLTGPANAGTWTKLATKDFEDCGYLFSGIIEKGDLVGFLNSGKLKGTR